MRAWAWLLSAALFHFVHISCTADDGGDGLPQTSADFFAAYSCNDGGEWTLLNHDEEGSFYRWVLAGRHITLHPGWGVATGSPADDDNNAGGETQYARVFDLLNWAREQKLMPVPADIASICHKGMEARYIEGARWANANRLPSKPNPHISNEMWNNLWGDCHKQLLSTTRLASACIDVPGVLVASPNPPWKANNPCHMEYRMVDGAHRLCLRKYALVLLHGELTELKELAKEPNEEMPTDEIKHQIEQTRRLIHQTSQGQYIVLDQATFASMLRKDDPHETWARSKEHLLKELPHDERQDWKEWMKLVLASTCDMGMLARAGGLYVHEKTWSPAVMSISNLLVPWPGRSNANSSLPSTEKAKLPIPK
ncbi:hypothetical protein ACHAXT_000418 [Thalassiosira profunda]